MKMIGLGIVVSALLMGCSTGSGTQSVEGETAKVANSETILGTWQCKFLVTNPDGSSMEFVSEDKYEENGKLSSIGVLSLDLKNTSVGKILEYSMSGDGGWHFSEEGKYLVTEANNVQVTNVSQTGFEDFIDIKSMFPVNVSVSTEILDFDGNKISLRVKSTGDTYSCNRA